MCGLTGVDGESFGLEMELSILQLTPGFAQTLLFSHLWGSLG